MIEVKANVTFGAYRIGRLYQVDPESPQIAGLLAGGYLQPSNDDAVDPASQPSVVDSAGPVLVSDTGVDVGVKRPAKKKVTDGPGEHEPGGSKPGVLPADDEAGKADS
jgi:hypothetical protein